MVNWTIGIITDGNQDLRLTYVLDSIIESSIRVSDQLYEIIICGNSKLDQVSIVPFDESQKTSWITRKKNLIVQKAKYENIVLMHDYIVFHPNWFRGWRDFADTNWDVCMNPIFNLDGTRFRDWTKWPPSPINYDDHTQIKNMYISGSYYCVKRDFALQNPLDEKLGWGEGEDVEWSLRLRDKWNYKCNKHSWVKLLKQKEPHWQ